MARFATANCQGASLCQRLSTSAAISSLERALRCTSGSLSSTRRINVQLRRAQASMCLLAISGLGVFNKQLRPPIPTAWLDRDVALPVYSMADFGEGNGLNGRNDPPVPAGGIHRADEDGSQRTMTSTSDMGRQATPTTSKAVRCCALDHRRSRARRLSA